MFLGLGWLVTLSVGGCRFESRIPESSPKDDNALQTVTTGFYRALAVDDTTALEAITFGSATVLLAAGHSEPSLIARRALPSIPERRTLPPGVRLVRTEIHPDGDFAVVRAVVAAQDGGRGGEFEASDWLTIARRGGEWRIAHILLGPWRIRTAP